ncbi:MAG: YhfC family glutamic-type intramembrane protease [Oscillospiraceae bacterium]
MTASFVLSIVMALVLFGVPVGFFFYYALKVPKYILPYVMGMVTFTVTQILLRFPLVSFLENMFWFKSFQMFHPIWATAFYAFSAGLFEEGGRYISMRYFMRERQGWNQAVIFGLGHGGVEAMWLLGLNLVYGLFADRGSLMALPTEALLISFVERVLAVLFHMAISVMVMVVVQKRKPLFLVLVMVIHGVFNFVPQLAIWAGVGNWAVEGIILLMVLALMAYAAYARKAEWLSEEEMIW